MKVAVLFDVVATRPDARNDDRSVIHVVDSVAAALGGRGHDVRCVPVGRGTEWIRSLAEDRPDAAFNLCESVAGRSALEAASAGVLELLGIPMTGCSAETLALARRKDRVNAVLAAAQLPVPEWDMLEAGALSRWQRFPAIVKPAGEDGSAGIEQTSVARDRAGLEAASRIGERFGPLLVQRYVDGREFNVGFVGPVELPISEIDFAQMPADHWRIVSWDAKWTPGSIEDRGTQPRCPAGIGPALEDELRRLARRTWQLVEGRGYGRVDLRVDADGRPWILEFNPNPDLSTDAGLARMAAAAGVCYAELVGLILEGAA